MPVRFEAPEEAAHAVMQAQAEQRVDGVLALGDGQRLRRRMLREDWGLRTITRRAWKLAKQVAFAGSFHGAGLPTPWFRSVPLQAIPEPALMGITYPAC